MLKLIDGKRAPDLVEQAGEGEGRARDVLRARAEELEKQAAKLKELAGRCTSSGCYDELAKVLSGPEEKIDLIHAALLIAKLDNEEVDVDAYRAEVERMAKKAAEGLPKDATERRSSRR